MNSGTNFEISLGLCDPVSGYKALFGVLLRDWAFDKILLANKGRCILYPYVKSLLWGFIIRSKINDDIAEVDRICPHLENISDVSPRKSDLKLKFFPKISRGRDGALQIQVAKNSS